MSAAGKKHGRTQLSKWKKEVRQRHGSSTEDQREKYEKVAYSTTCSSLKKHFPEALRTAMP